MYTLRQLLCPRRLPPFLKSCVETMGSLSPEMLRAPINMYSCSSNALVSEARGYAIAAEHVSGKEQGLKAYQIMRARKILKQRVSAEEANSRCQLSPLM
jgi:hypothetical protein